MIRHTKDNSNRGKPAPTQLDPAPPRLLTLELKKFRYDDEPVHPEWATKMLLKHWVSSGGSGGSSDVSPVAAFARDVCALIDKLEADLLRGAVRHETAEQLRNLVQRASLLVSCPEN